jgi:hypothetical protein
VLLHRRLHLHHPAGGVLRDHGQDLFGTSVADLVSDGVITLCSWWISAAASMGAKGCPTRMEAASRSRRRLGR